MSVIEIIILILGIGLMNVLCFLIGAKTGQKVVKGEEVELPTLNPIEAVRHYEEKKELKQEEENYRIMMENINNYDGSSLGQLDFK